MKKRDKWIKDITEDADLEAIIKRCKVCHVGMVEDNFPYVLAFNFGFEDNAVWLHCAKEGHKIDILNKNPNVCVYFDTDHDLFARNQKVACSWRMRYRSVMAHGKAVFVEDFDEKVKGLNIFMKNYSEKNFEYSKPAVNNIIIIKIPIEKWSGRSFEY